MGQRGLATRGDGLAGSQTGASPWRWLEMGVTGMVSRLAGVHGGCEPGEEVGGGCRRHDGRAQGGEFWGVGGL